MTETKDTLKDIKKDRKAFMNRMKDENSASYYFTVICASQDERDELFRKMGIPFSEEFVASELLHLLN